VTATVLVGGPGHGVLCEVTSTHDPVTYHPSTGARYVAPGVVTGQPMQPPVRYESRQFAGPVLEGTRDVYQVHVLAGMDEEEAQHRVVWLDPQVLERVKMRTQEAPTAPLDDTWKPGRWWRAVSRSGAVWVESSDEEEVRERAREAPYPVTVQRGWDRVEHRWVDA
jgi:hypothetical protein